AWAASLKLFHMAMKGRTGGTFVAPTAETMGAAVASMKPNAQGVLQPVIAPVTAAAGLGVAATVAYPLTYVEYAFVPAEPLVDPSTCLPRTTSQSLLTKWLQYLTGPGQQNLAAGLAPLPASLQQQAAAGIRQAGAAP